MTIIEQIKAEIERLHAQHSSKYGTDEAGLVLERLEDFLDTLESEKPIIPDGLDEEIHSFFDECIEVHEVPLYGKVKENVITADCYEITARHFAKWGKEQGYREGFLEGTKIQREEDNQLVDTIYQQGIEKGKDEMMEQMLKDAVEGEVYKFGEVAYVKERSNAELTKYLSQFNNGDRVKIIVIHETDIR